MSTRALAMGLGATAALGCHACEPPPDPSPAASASVGMMRVSADYGSLVPEPPEGFEACHDAFAPPLTREQRLASRRAFDEHPPSPHLSALPAKASRVASSLTVSARGAAPVTFPLGRWADVVHVSPIEVRAQLRSDGEWNSHYGALLSSLLPADGFVAFAGEEDWRESSVYTDLGARVYVVEAEPEEVLRVLTRDGRTVLRWLACDEEEGPFNRAAFRVEPPAADRPRVRLSASLFFGDYGGTATVDVWAGTLPGGGSWVWACMYSGRAEDPRCAAASPAATRPDAGSR